MSYRSISSLTADHCKEIGRLDHKERNRSHWLLQTGQLLPPHPPSDVGNIDIISASVPFSPQLNYDVLNPSWLGEREGKRYDVKALLMSTITG